ncbi:MAG: hypothetical protein K2Z25_21090 [Beijerinckiaceae bacterium]|nr:hypothetical protein [Beijerinckiaceae bacterium]
MIDAATDEEVREVLATGHAKLAEDIPHAPRVAANLMIGLAMRCEALRSAEPAAWQRHDERLGWTHVDAIHAKRLAAGGVKVRALYPSPTEPN